MGTSHTAKKRPSSVVVPAWAEAVTKGEIPPTK